MFKVSVNAKHGGTLSSPHEVKSDEARRYNESELNKRISVGQCGGTCDM